VACQDNGKFLEVGKVASGLKELEDEEGSMTYEEMTALLKPLISGEEGKVVRVEPKVVLSVTYQNIQGSPAYSSGLALRFPRVTAYRPDKSVSEIATLAEVEREAKKQER
jgi:DNA ligase-1